MASVIRGSDNFDSLTSQGVGFGQTWQDVTASRAGGTTYTNTTGKPIMVCITCTQSSSGTESLTIGGVIVAYMIYVNSVSSKHLVCGIVPNNTTYLLTLSTNTLTTWSELR